MKTTKTLFITLICSFIFSLAVPSAISFAGHPIFSLDVCAAPNAAPPKISPASDTIVWRYKTVNGVMYKRKYNQTTGQWIGKWIKA